MLSSAAEITVGDVLVFFPDDDSLKEDQALGYYLAASFGKVIKTDASNVHVEWLYGETYSSTFRPFVQAIEWCQLYQRDPRKWNIYR